MNYPLRFLSGLIAGTGGLILLFQGHTTAGVAILASMLAFFVGDVNGRREAGSA